MSIPESALLKGNTGALFSFLEKGAQADSFVDYLVSGSLVGMISISFIAADHRVAHWFILPGIVAGTLSLPDLIRWLRGSMDLFDPKGLLGLWLFFGWFLAPLLHVYSGYYGPELEFTGDQRYWLGISGCLNALGIICYKIAQRWSFNYFRPAHTYRGFLPQRILPILAIATIIGLCAQAVFYAKFGAVAHDDLDTATAAMRGTGWLLMLGDGLPVLLSLGFIAWTLSSPSKRTSNWTYILLFLCSTAVLQFIWSGLRGSRSAFVFAMVWIAGLVHYYWKPFRTRHLLLALIPFLLFMYLYGFYKDQGSRALKAVHSTTRNKLEKETGRTFTAMLLGDLARADVSASIANGVMMHRNNYELRYGRTYLQPFSKLVPGRIWDWLLGDSSFLERWSAAHAFFELNEGSQGKGVIHDYQRSSRIYALTGESMLNFGPLGVPWSWLLLGLEVGWFRRKLYSLQRGDARWALIPFLAPTISRIPNTHLEATLFYLVKAGVVLVICTYLWSRKIELE
jgi:hypothetical protein